MKPALTILLMMISVFILPDAQGQTANWTWANQVVGNDWSPAQDIKTDANNNVYACGFFMDSARWGTYQLYSSKQRAYVVKYDSNGLVQWVNTFPCNNGSFADRICTDHQNNIYVVGYFSGTLTAGSYTLTTTFSGINNFFLIKIDPAGNVIWARQSNSSGTTQATDIAIDNSDNIYIAGNNGAQTTFGSLSASKVGMFILKYNSGGTPVRLINESGCLSNSLNISMANEIYFTGDLTDTTVIGNDTLFPAGYYEYIYIGADTDTVYTYYNDILLLCYDSSGNVIWNRQATSKGYNLWTYSALDNNSNMFVCGNLSDTTNFWGTTIPSSGNNTPYVLKLDPLGNIIWEKHGQPVTPNGFVYLRDIAVSDGYSYLAGFNGGISAFSSLTVYGNSMNINTVILKLDSAGIGLWSIADTTNKARNEPAAIALDQDKDISVCGFFEDSVHFGNHHLNALPAGELVMFVAKMSSLPLFVEDPDYHANNLFLRIFPNPFHSLATLEWKDSYNNAELKIYNIYGQQIKQLKIISRTTIINREGLADGMYLYQLTSDKGIRASGKVIIE